MAAFAFVFVFVFVFAFTSVVSVVSVAAFAFAFEHSRSGKIKPMLTNYIRAAMAHAVYEILSDKTYYGEIPGLAGVYANADTLDACRGQLQEVLEGWIVLGLRMNHAFPEVDGIRLDIAAEVV